MITYRKEKNRHYFGFSGGDLSDLAELIWLMKHTPPPVGFHRKPLTTAQQRVVDDLYDLITYPTDFAAIINAKTGQ